MGTHDVNANMFPGSSLLSGSKRTKNPKPTGSFLLPGSIMTKAATAAGMSFTELPARSPCLQLLRLQSLGFRVKGRDAVDACLLASLSQALKPEP